MSVVLGVLPLLMLLVLVLVVPQLDVERDEEEKSLIQDRSWQDLLPAAEQ